ncbi:PLP-dependent aminotransferase family protein [Deinococcus misasensis]|uniref:aminotransferase-like domain-containing protein n=1 Tax=Deinococcus misasensis TaxID=392413 RepID=UPI00068DB829|nr:PLP-dependent aminotransferase family protein [Deinococcus misasensis]
MSETGATERIYQDLLKHLLTLQAGDSLPSSRTLVAQHQASPNTIQKVFSRLIQEGKAVSRAGKGLFKAEVAPVVTPQQDYGWQSVLLGASPGVQQDFQSLYTPPPTGLLSLGSGYLDSSLQPTQLLAEAMQKASRRPLVWDRVPPEGLPPLRNWFAGKLGVQASDILITAGAQSALSSIFSVLSHLPNTPVLVESPCHLGTLAILRSQGMKPIPIPMDAHGMRPDLLEQVLQHTPARLLACQPTHQNPTGVCWTLERRQEILRICKKHGVLIIEDGAAQDLSFQGAPPPHLVTLAPEQVIHVYSLTKPVAAGFRIAAIAARGPIRQRLSAALVVGDLFVTGVMQEAALEVVTSKRWPKHLQNLQNILQARQQTLTTELKLRLPAWRIHHTPSGGFYLWVELPEGMDDPSFSLQALQKQVQVSAGQAWFPAEKEGAFLRLSFAGIEQVQIAQAVSGLVEASQNVQANTAS